jgi:hypothetical protein
MTPWKWYCTRRQAPGRTQEEDVLMAKGLQAAYDQVLGLFNKGDYPGLMGVIDADIILKRVLNPGSVVGIGNVEAYLRTHMMPLKPSFKNVAPTLFPKPPADQTAVNAHVRGEGDYYDDTVNKPAASTHVHFVWMFTRSNTSEDWSLIHVFGCPIK